jgi:nucleotide-binding universal stress UspA family protein
MRSHMLVATDGEPGASGALRTARLLARHHGSSVEVIAVLEPMGRFLASDSLETVSSFPPHFETAGIDRLRAKVRSQLVEIGDEAAGWPVSVKVGRTAPTVARVAVEKAASLIVLGLREPRAAERWLGRESLLRLVHIAHVPVMAVPASASRLPREVVLAVDFSEFSLRAGHEVVRTVAPAGRLHLVHVALAAGMDGGGSELTEWQRTYRSGVERRLQELAVELGAAAPDAGQAHILAGDPAGEILRLADELGADLIAAGSHGAGFIGRILLGSVSSKLVYGARCSVLIVPPRAVPDELLLDLSERELLENLGNAGDLALSDTPPTA